MILDWLHLLLLVSVRASYAAWINQTVSFSRKDQNCIKYLKGLEKHLNKICWRKDVENSKKHELWDITELWFCIPLSNIVK